MRRQTLRLARRIRPPQKKKDNSKKKLSFKEKKKAEKKAKRKDRARFYAQRVRGSRRRSLRLRFVDNFTSALDPQEELLPANTRITPFLPFLARQRQPRILGLRRRAADFLRARSSALRYSPVVRSVQGRRALQIRYRLTRSLSTQQLQKPVTGKLTASSRRGHHLAPTSVKQLFRRVRTLKKSLYTYQGASVLHIGPQVAQLRLAAPLLYRGRASWRTRIWWCRRHRSRRLACRKRRGNRYQRRNFPRAKHLR